LITQTLCCCSGEVRIAEAVGESTHPIKESIEEASAKVTRQLRLMFLQKMKKKPTNINLI
jgi:hypothetical protein